MATNLNTVQIIGNLTRDVETRTTGTEKVVASLSIAVNGRKGSAPTFVDVVAWEGLGKLAAEHLAKGSKIAVAGRLQSSTWETDGKKRSKLEVVAEHIEFLTPKAADQVTDADSDEQPY